MIVLLSDFGYRDGYAGTIKGVIKKINPKVEIIDLSHGITPQNIDEAAFILWSSYNFFPDKTIFLSVVDPGVGSNRRIILLKTSRFTFIAPDNGLLKYILSEEKEYKIFEVTDNDFFFKNISNTFHGRDIFAPVAGYLSKGVKEGAIAREIKIGRQDLFIKVSTKQFNYSGKIIYIDRFGNAISNIFSKKSVKGRIMINDFKIRKISKSYFDSKGNEPIAVIGSSNLIEIAINKKNASEILKIKVDDNVDLTIDK